MRKRVTMPVLLVLVAFVIGAGLVVYEANEDAEADAERAERRRPMLIELGGHLPDGPSSGSGWRHHAWGAGEDEAGADPDGLMGASPVSDDYDPQLLAMRRSFGVQGDAGVPLPFNPSEHEAQIVDSEGLMSANDRCEVRVLPVADSRFNCLVRVMCGGEVLYPNPEQTAGYAPCDVENGVAINAHDDGHTAADGDPLVSIDLHAGIVTVEDRGDGVAPFRATLRLGRRRML
jgi:hypothetical protein